MATAQPEIVTMGAVKAPAGILGNASQSQIAHVMSKIGNANERVLGVWAADEDAASKQALQNAKGLTLLSLFWPKLVLENLSVVKDVAQAKRVIKHSVYFITDRGFGAAVMSYDGCCSPENDYTYSPWDQAISVSVSNTGWFAFLNTPSVVITQQGYHTFAGYKRRNGQVWYVNNLDEVAAVVRKKMAEYKDEPTIPAVEAGPAGVRVFVAFAATPEDRRIAILNPSSSFDEMTDALSIALGAPTAGMPISLAPAGQPPMAVTSPSMVRADDVILVG